MILRLKLRGWTIITENADYLYLHNYSIPSPADFKYHNTPDDLLENYNELVEQLVCESINKGDLGYHDHYIVSVPVNVDSFGKNVLYIMNWNDNNPFKVSDSFISCSTFQIGDYSGETQNKEWTVLK